MTTVLTQTEKRTDNRLYFVERRNFDGQKRIVKKFWHQLDNNERAAQIEAENREYYTTLFNIY